jgi:hypothetical protein
MFSLEQATSCVLDCIIIKKECGLLTGSIPETVYQTTTSSALRGDGAGIQHYMITITFVYVAESILRVP